MSTQMPEPESPLANSTVPDGPTRRHGVEKLGRRPSVGLRLLLVGGLVGTLLALPALAKNHYDRKNGKGNQVIVRVDPADVEPIAVQYGLSVAGVLDSDEEFAAIFEAPDALTLSQVEGLLVDDPRVLSVVGAELASLPTTDTIRPDVDSIAGNLRMVGDFTTPCLSQGFAGLLWSGFADQDAIRRVHLHEAHALNGDCGSAVVAVIDTGVDPDHPLLAGHLVDGYDFVLDQPGIPSEWTSLEETQRASLELSVVAILEGSEDSVKAGTGDLFALESVTPVLDLSVVAILESDPPPPSFGHGTMVAGLVRLSAPAARIMPLKVFDAAGEAHLFDIVRAIYHAVDHGADVINMSFSMEDASPELVRAVQYAHRHGVVCVASAGNRGELAQVYPGALGTVIGVASLDNDDHLATFSNYGSGLVELAAPGEGMISIYPGGLYGAGWGTSFSAPLVAGAMALQVHHHPNRDVAALEEMTQHLNQGSTPLPDLQGLVGSGRLDAFATVLAAQE